MISKQKQIGILRSSLITQLNKLRIKEAMLNAVKSRGQIATGGIVSAIAKIQYNNAVRLTNSEFDSYTGIIKSVNVTVSFNFAAAKYAKFIDSGIRNDGESYFPMGGRNNSAKMSRIIQWIKSKPSTYFNRISVDGLSESKIKKLAFNIVRKQKRNKNRIRNTSRFISNRKPAVNRAIDAALKTFVNYLDREIAQDLEKRILKGL